MNTNTPSHNPAFAGKVIAITGGSNGIGKQLAKDLSRQGAQIIICSNQLSSLEQARTELTQVGCQIDTCVCDVRYMEQVSQFAQYILRQNGHVDILINNAGYAVYRPFEESSVEEVLDLVDVNLSGAMRCTKAFLPNMIARCSGRIVNISSIGGETIITPNAIYCAAKHGMVAWSKAIRYELARFNIAVNVICPGHTKTSFHDHPTFRRRDPYRSKNARSLTVEAVSTAVMDAVLKDRVVTYVPWWQGLVVWALNALPFMTVPIWDWLTQKRITQLYEQIEQEQKSR